MDCLNANALSDSIERLCVYFRESIIIISGCLHSSKTLPVPLKKFPSKFKTVEIEGIGERENDVPNNTPGHNSVFLMIVRIGERVTGRAKK